MTKATRLLFAFSLSTIVQMLSAQEQASPGSMGLLLGWYDSANHPQELSSYAELGFTTSVPYSSSSSDEQLARYMKDADKYGIQTFMQIPSRLLKTEDTKALQEFIETQKVLPFFGWYLADEPELNKDVREESLSSARDLIRAIDGRPIFIMNYRTSAIKTYAPLADYVGVNYYPAFKWTAPFIYTSEAFYARISRAAKEATKAGRKLMLAVQGYGKAEDGSDQFLRRLPTFQETRYMFWAALSVEPAGILYWVRYRTDPAWVSVVLRAVMREFREWFPGDLSYWSPVGYSAPSIVSCAGLQDINGKRYALFVNNGFCRAKIALKQSGWAGARSVIGGNPVASGKDLSIMIRGHELALVLLEG